MKERVTLQGAESKLKSFFKGVEGDYVSIQTIFRNEDRDLNAQKDKNWFYNQSSILKKYELAYPLKGVKNHLSVTLGLTLTDKGRAVINELASQDDGVQMSKLTTEKPSEVTLASWRQDAYILQEKYPELIIEFDVRMRKEDE